MTAEYKKPTVQVGSVCNLFVKIGCGRAWETGGILSYCFPLLWPPKKNIKKEIFTKSTVLLDIARPFDACGGLFEFFLVFSRFFK